MKPTWSILCTFTRIWTLWSPSRVMSRALLWITAKMLVSLQRVLSTLSSLWTASLLISRSMMKLILYLQIRVVEFWYPWLNPLSSLMTSFSFMNVGLGNDRIQLLVFLYLYSSVNTRLSINFSNCSALQSLGSLFWNYRAKCALNA